MHGLATADGRNKPLPGAFQTCMVSTSMVSIETPERLKKIPMGRPVLHRRRWPSLFCWVPCCCATAHSSLLRPSCSLATGGSAVSPALIRVRLDYLQGQGRLMRPPRDGSLQIHPSQGPSGRTFGTESLALAGYLLPAGSPSMSD